MRRNWRYLIIAMGVLACDSTVEPTLDAAIPRPDTRPGDVLMNPDSGPLSRDMGVGTDLGAGALDARVTDVGTFTVDATSRDLSLTPEDGSVDQGGSDGRADAQTEADSGRQVTRICPGEPAVEMCALGRTSREMVNDDRLYITRLNTRPTAQSMSALEAQQLVDGFACEGLFMPDTAEAAFATIDDGGVAVFRIRRVRPVRYFTWLRFYMGDTEVGYIFNEGTRTLVALVSDQDLSRCTESTGDAPPLTCPQLAECLQACDEANLDCRRPCIRAADPVALDAFIDWDECRGDCEGNPACLDRICADERAACFGR